MARTPERGPTRAGQRAKYERDAKYNAAPQDLSLTVDNRYSVGHWYGRRFESEKIRILTGFARQAGLDIPNARILDVGCHRGRIANLWAELAGNAKLISGCDFIPTFIETARAVNPGISFFQHDLYKPLPKKLCGLDCISAIYVYNSIPAADQPPVSKHLDEGILPGGYILLFDFYDSWIVRLRQSLVSVLRRISRKPAKTYLPRLSTRRVRELFPGYRVVANRRCMNLWSYPLLRMGTIIHDIVDCFLPGEYYAVMLQKPENRDQ
ncbi:MAG TPA: class I SAM-dependent methyltransferase [Spirochaetota bacterium]|nr:class I SAM-dependent methyltransferase [Spirochaetota bacterium]